MHTNFRKVHRIWLGVAILARSRYPVVLGNIVDDAKRTSRNKKSLTSDGDDLNSVHECDGKPRWARNVHWCAYFSAGVLLLNIIFASVLTGLAGKLRAKTTNSFWSFQAVYQGSCYLVKRWDMALHLLINLFSTMTLAASSYCMQTLVAPSREDVDRYHVQGKWLDIGIPGIRNLAVFGPYRLGLWCTLLLTATPFHLLYNSAISKAITLSGSALQGLFIPSDIDLQHVSRLTTPRIELCPNKNSVGLAWHEITSSLANGSYEKVNTDRCSKIISDHDNLQVETIVMRTSELTSRMGGNRAVRFSDMYNYDEKFTGYQVGGLWEFTLESAYGPMNWTTKGFQLDFCYQYDKAEVCDDAQNLISWLETIQPDTPGQIDTYIKTLSSNITVKPEIPGYCSYRWGPTRFDVEDCLVIQRPQACELGYSPLIFVLVIVTTTVKVVVMFLVVRQRAGDSKPLLTLGDAVASFLAQPDPMTLGICWMTRFDLKDKSCGWKKSYHATLKGTLRRPYIWIRAAKWWRKLTAMILWSICIVCGAYGFRQLMYEWCFHDWSNCPDMAFKRFWAEGFDTSKSDKVRLLGPKLSIIAMALLANLPQLFLTVSYHFYNSVLTSILAEAEYNSYGTKQKGLRVSWPHQNSSQRSTYWLSVPFRYSVPLLVIYLAISWSVSQSFYLMRERYSVTSESHGGYDVESSLKYSPIAIFVSLILFCVMGAFLLALGLCKRFKSRLPLAGGCSAIISAACHPPAPGDDALHEVQWGETSSSPEGLTNEHGIGHCSFTSKDVVEPSEDKYYH